MKTFSRLYALICFIALVTIEPMTVDAVKWYFTIIIPNSCISAVLLLIFGETKEFENADKSCKI